MCCFSCALLILFDKKTHQAFALVRFCFLIQRVKSQKSVIDCCRLETLLRNPLVIHLEYFLYCNL